MITIEINERTKAGKALLDTAMVLAKTNKGIAICNEATDKALVKKMLAARKSGIMSETEKTAFLNKLSNVANQ